jgi:hypothetical protein
VYSSSRHQLVYFNFTFATYDVITGASCPDGTLFLPTIAGSKWTAKDGVYTLVSCPAGYELARQECTLCPAASYCPGGSDAHVPCLDGLFSTPGSESPKACRQVVFVFVSILFPVSTDDLSGSDLLSTKQMLALLGDIFEGDVQRVGISEAGFGRTVVTHKI